MKKTRLAMAKTHQLLDLEAGKCSKVCIFSPEILLGLWLTVHCIKMMTFCYFTFLKPLFHKDTLFFKVFCSKSAACHGKSSLYIFFFSFRFHISDGILLRHLFPDVEVKCAPSDKKIILQNKWIGIKFALMY
jgi:hypothetical protein